jgi:arylsulfatase A
VHGIDIASHLENANNKLSRDYVLCTNNADVFGIRNGDWKYLPFSSDRFANKVKLSPLLFYLKDNISEKTNLYDTHPDIVKMLAKEILIIETTLENK